MKTRIHTANGNTRWQLSRLSCVVSAALFSVMIAGCRQTMSNSASQPVPLRS